MVRALVTVLITTGMAVLAVAQDGKEKAKAPPRIAVNDPAALKDDRDFAVQGEYVGISGTSKRDERSSGAHVIALGGGKFDVRLYSGGLPGDGWDGKADEMMMKGEWKGDKLVCSATERGEAFEFAYIEGGKLKSYFHLLEKKERKSATLGARPPDGAVVLFGGPGDEKNWTNGKLVKLSDGEFLNNGIKSKQAFGSFKAHVEFRLPWMPNSRGQGRANSGVYVQDRYEIQVLDSLGLTGENNECGGIYTQHKPLVNMCYPPMQWQTFDIDFTAAEFGPDGKKTKNARLTVRHNGVKIHDNVELPKECPGGQKETAAPGPFQFQNHGDPVVFRNVWVVPAESPLPPSEARAKVGQRVTVEMLVKSAKDRLDKRGEIYLDSEDDFRSSKNFAVVITRAGAANIRKSGIEDPADHFNGKVIRATGEVKMVEDVPRIEVAGAEQIEVVR